jgi:hypothetical protein
MWILGIFWLYNNVCYSTKAVEMAVGLQSALKSANDYIPCKTT